MAQTERCAGTGGILAHGFWTLGRCSRSPVTGETGAFLLLLTRVSVSDLLTIQVFGVLDLELSLVYWKNLFLKPQENKSFEVLKNLHPW